MRPLLFAFCLMPAFAQAETPRVATDIAPVHSIVSQVMQGVGEPALIIPPGASPHGYAMRPSEARALAAADLVVWVGPTLTPWMIEPLDALAGDARTIALEDVPGINLMPFRTGTSFDAHDHDHGHSDGHSDDHAEKDDHTQDKAHAHEEDHDHTQEAEHDHDAEHKDDHDHGHSETDHDDGQKDHDDHAHGTDGQINDPHLWLDPANGMAAMTHLAAVLSEMDPANAETYVANAAAGVARLQQVSEQIAAQLAPLEGQPFIVSHDAYHYFEARFGVEASAAVSPGDAATPGAARVAALRAHVTETGAVCAFAEPQMNTALLATVVEGAGTQLGTLDPLGVDLEPGADLYPAMLQGLADGLTACLTP